MLCIRWMLPAAFALAATISCSSGGPTASPPAATRAATPKAAAPAADVGGGRGLADVQEIRKAEFTEVVVPGGTTFDVALDTPLSSNGSRIEDPVRAHVTSDVLVRGKIAIPSGTELVGTVLQASAAYRVKGRAELAFRLLTLRPGGGESIAIRTDRITRDAPSVGTDVSLSAGTIFPLSLDDAIRMRVRNE